jgi:hypothetical protein
MPSEKRPARRPATLGQADQPEHLLDPGPRDGVAGRQRAQVGAGAAAGVERPGLQQRPDLAQGPAQVAVAAAADPACPASGVSRPRIRRMVVDLPEPLGPRKPVTMPDLTSKVRDSTATVAP